MLRLLDATKNIEWLSRLKKGTAPNQSQETIPSSCEIWANPAKIVLPFPNSLSITLSLFIKLCQRWDHSLILVLLSCIGPVMLALNWPWTGPERQTNKTKNWLSTKVLIGDECSEYHSISLQFCVLKKLHKRVLAACGTWLTTCVTIVTIRLSSNWFYFVLAKHEPISTKASPCWNECRQPSFAEWFVTVCCEVESSRDEQIKKKAEALHFCAQHGLVMHLWPVLVCLLVSCSVWS